MAESAPTVDAAPAAAQADWRAYLTLWLASRIWVVSIAYVAVFRWQDEGWETWERLLNVLAYRWDAEYYMRIAEHGYPNVLPTAADHDTHHWGFYPLFPWLIRGMGAVTGIPMPLCAVLINAVLGMVAAVLLGTWFRRHLGEHQTQWAVAFFCFWTQSYFFTYAYGEPLYMVLVSCMLLLLDDKGPVPRTRTLPLAFTLGLVTGFARPYAALVALAAFLGIAWKLPRQGFLRAAWESQRLRACVACGLGVAVSIPMVWWGLCWIHTGIFENCTVHAWVVGWAYGKSTLPETLARDVLELLREPGWTWWHSVMTWELVALVVTVCVLVLSFRLVPALGLTPVALALLPILTNTSLPHIGGVPRYLATTPTVFIVLSWSHDRPALRTVLMVVILALHIMAGAATAMGVWGSF